MGLKLNHENIDLIIFGMENQEQFYVFNLTTGEVMTEDTLDEERKDDTIIDLPEWNSSMGFQLMEKFVANLRNPVYREILRDTLSSGKGVFRKFKNALRERPDIERLWFQFKEREMREYVIEWLSTIEEARDLEKVSVEEEDETDELVLSDFLLTYDEKLNWEEYEALDRETFEENRPDVPPEVIRALYEDLKRWESLQGEGVLRSETPDGGLAAFLWYSEREAGNETASGQLYARIKQLVVVPEYRGLGLARTLMERYLEDAYRRGVEWVFTQVEGEAIGFADSLVSTGFRRSATGLQLNLHKWGMENLYS